MGGVVYGCIGIRFRFINSLYFFNCTVNFVHVNLSLKHHDIWLAQFPSLVMHRQGTIKHDFRTGSRVFRPTHICDWHRLTRLILAPTVAAVYSSSLVQSRTTAINQASTVRSVLASTPSSRPRITARQGLGIQQCSVHSTHSVHNTHFVTLPPHVSTDIKPINPPKDNRHDRSTNFRTVTAHHIVWASPGSVCCV